MAVSIVFSGFNTAKYVCLLGQTIIALRVDAREFPGLSIKMVDKNLYFDLVRELVKLKIAWYGELVFEINVNKSTLPSIYFDKFTIFKYYNT